MVSDNGQNQDPTPRVNTAETQESGTGVSPLGFETRPQGEPESPIEEHAKPGRVAQFMARLRRPPEATREMKSGERTRGLVILAGTMVACLVLFFGLFTTDSGANRADRKTKPSLGRPETASVDPEAANRSLVPQLSVNQQPNEESGELTEKDVLGTMRNRGTPVPTENPPAATTSTAPKQPPSRGSTLSTVNIDDPALSDAYRRQGLTPPPRRTEVTDWNQAIADYQAKQKQVPAPPPLPVANVSDSLRKSSMVFVRTTVETAAPRPSGPIPVLERKPVGLLPQGTALVARLQHSVSSAAKVPVSAVIEYNYEENGQLVVPAGTKAYGDLSQATPQGWVSINFHTLEFPSGEQEKINGSALSMDRGVLRGDVNGKNTAKKFLTRTLTGVGTIAAFAVGGRGLSGNLDNSVLLRERISSNVALAGEQELGTLAYQQNIVVTVPANTRFYLVLHEAGVTRPATSPVNPVPQITNQNAGSAIQAASTRDAASEQELSEMIQLRNELREMNRLMQFSAPRTGPTSSDNQ
jgi:hypothetical protein